MVRHSHKKDPIKGPCFREVTKLVRDLLKLQGFRDLAFTMLGARIRGDPWGYRPSQ